MKVMHVFTTGGSAYGVERTLLSMLPSLTKNGIECHVVAVVELRAGGISRETVVRLAASGSPYGVIETASRSPFPVARQLREVIEREKPDIVHTHTYKTDAALVLSRAKVRRVCTVHGWCSRTKKERFYEWLDVQFQKRFDVVIALCEDYRQRLMRRGVRNDKIRVVHVGVDAAALATAGIDFRGKWGIAKDAPLVVQVGRLSPEKNPMLFIEAAKRVLTRVPDCRFVFVGDGPMRDEVCRAIEPVKDNILLAGYVQEIGDVLRAADVVASCSTTEGLLGVLLEAGAMRVPVAATLVGGATEIVEDGVTGLLSASGDVDAMERNLLKLVESPGLRLQLGSAAEERMLRLFNVDFCAQQLKAVYDELVA